MNQFICLDGRILPAGQAVLPADNRGFRYGDGLFETIRMTGGRLPLWDLHAERLLAGLDLLAFRLPGHFGTDLLRKEVEQLGRKNGCTASARIRLTLFRGAGGLFEGLDSLHYLIECWPLAPVSSRIQDNGLEIAVFPDARKTTDRFANCKTANYLPYVMAAIHARRHRLNECVLLNDRGGLADATTSNLVLIREGRIRTPSLAEGGVAGVMRRHLLARFRDAGLEPEEVHLEPADLENADEVFLTNALHGIRWVKSCGGSNYTMQRSAQLYRQFIHPLFS